MKSLFRGKSSEKDFKTVSPSQEETVPRPKASAMDYTPPAFSDQRSADELTKDDFDLLVELPMEFYNDVIEPKKYSGTMEQMDTIYKCIDLYNRALLEHQNRDKEYLGLPLLNWKILVYLPKSDTLSEIFKAFRGGYFADYKGVNSIYDRHVARLQIDLQSPKASVDELLRMARREYPGITAIAQQVEEANARKPDPGKGPDSIIKSDTNALGGKSRRRRKLKRKKSRKRKSTNHKL